MFCIREGEPASNFWKVLYKIIGSIIYIAAAVGTFYGIVALIYPAISISQSSLLNPIDPFSSFFIVSNDGNLNIKSITFDCVIHNLTSPKLNVVGSDFQDHKYDLDILKPGEKTSIKCPLGSFIKLEDTPNYNNVDIILAIRFKVGFLPWYQNRLYRFVIEQGSDNTLHWYPQPNSVIVEEPLLEKFIKGQ